jgi:hypothetical protein
MFTYGNKLNLVKDTDNYDNNDGISFGIYKPSFGKSFKCNSDDISKIGRLLLGNILVINKMLAFNQNIDINIYDNDEKEFVIDVKNKLDIFFVSFNDYKITVSKMLKNRDSSLRKFLIYNENFITKYYDKKYELHFKNLKTIDIEKLQNTMQYELRNKTYKESILLLNPEYKRYFNFGKREKTLLNSFIRKQREQYFHNENEFLEWIEKNEEFILLKEWNYAWILENMLKIYIVENKKNDNKQLYIVISELSNNLEILNNKLGRDNNNY